MTEPRTPKRVVAFVEEIASATDEKAARESVRRARADAAMTLTDYPPEDWKTISVEVPAIALAWLVYGSRKR